MDWPKILVNGGLVVAVVLIMLLPVWLLTQLVGQEAEVQLGLVIVLGVAVLLVLLFLMAVVYKLNDLADPKQALALPEGSVRALIALILIMLFVFIGIYLFRIVGADTVTIRNLSPEQVAALGSRVASTTQLSGTNLLNVTLTGGVSEEGARLAQQLLATIATLVVAVSGFYFGTSATSAGATVGARAAGAANAPLAIGTPSQLPAGKIGQAYAGAKLAASGGTPPYSWRVLASGALPAGLTLNPDTGDITGTPTAAGAPFSVQVEDKTGLTTTKEFELPVA